MTLSYPAQKLLRVLKESGPRNLNIVRGLVGRENLARVIGELFIVGMVEWVGAKRGRKLAARTR